MGDPAIVPGQLSLLDVLLDRAVAAAVTARQGADEHVRVAVLVPVAEPDDAEEADRA